MVAPAPTARVLVVDDEAGHAESLVKILQKEGYEVQSAADGVAALEKARQFLPQVILTDLVMPRMGGTELLKGVRTVVPECEVILMTAYGTVENAVEAMREGAYDFLSKPVKRGHVVATVRRALEKQALLTENRQLRAELENAKGAAGPDLVGAAPPMQKLRELVAQVAPSSATVLLLGESGTGKERVAREIHRLSNRSSRAFVAVNCAALPESILESELFGSERGAFTGAVSREGRFERAHGGTMLLDEIGDLPAQAQVKLLRVLQEGEVERLGGGAPRKVDVRIVAATHRDLKQYVAEGRFREDLFYRLAVITLAIPPLRERLSDLPLLVSHFLARHGQKHGKPVRGMSQDAMAALHAHGWKGNVRELENALERAVVLCRGDVIQRADLPEDIAGGTGAPPAQDQLSIRVGTPMADVERQVIRATLARCNDDKALAARLLGISVRTIYRRLGEMERTQSAVDEETDPSEEGTP
ncbi:MAG: sigma-54-dependent Fis family transcriptional regulator [Deltaproteobacteria bacterium]|nr:sigma-54-dependent Fis family transcriptional regulator [Deltaproteobacteria bacterium]